PSPCREPSSVALTTARSWSSPWSMTSTAPPRRTVNPCAVRFRRRRCAATASILHRGDNGLIGFHHAQRIGLHRLRDLFEDGSVFIHLNRQRFVLLPDGAEKSRRIAQ